VLNGIDGDVELLVDEFAADVVLLCQDRDGLTSQSVQGELLALRRAQQSSRTVGGSGRDAVIEDNGLVGVLGQSYDAHGRDLRRLRVVGAILDLLDPGFFAHPCSPLLLPQVEPGLRSGLVQKAGVAGNTPGEASRERERPEMQAL
jgi:hypothetical protein